MCRYVHDALCGHFRRVFHFPFRVTFSRDQSRVFITSMTGLWATYIYLDLVNFLAVLLVGPILAVMVFEHHEILLAS